MSTDQLPIAEPVRWEAEAALKFAADKDGLSLHGVNTDLIARIVARRVLIAAANSGEVVEKAKHDQEVEKLKTRVKRFEGYWASAKVVADRQLMRVQSALFEMEDRDLAERLADQIGVILPEAPDALFEQAS